MSAAKLLGGLRLRDGKMTAEVAVINRLAVALAADSAVTIGHGETTKIFPSENKIFELSATKPVGLMLYHSTQFFGTPWEIIAKEFRRERSGHACKTLFGWVEEFKEFLLRRFCPTEKVQKVFVRDILSAELTQVRDRFYAQISEHLFKTKKKFIKPGDRDKFFRGNFNLSLNKSLEDQNIWVEGTNISREKAESWLKSYDDIYRTVYDELFADLPLLDEENNKLREISALSLMSQKPGDFTTGLVFAGFGDEDMFPSLHCMEIHGMVSNELRYVDLEQVDIDNDKQTAEVIPFAQRDTADSLLFGRSSDYEQRAVEHFRDVIHQIGDGLVDELVKGKIKRNDYKGRVKQASDQAVERFYSTVSPDIKRALASDTLDIVRHMPKQEIAAFAESLVAVSSIKRKVTVGPETVGGPVDVAVISRHEGFVWVRRKYYFNPAINPRYMARSFNASQWVSQQEGDKNEE